MTRICCMNYRNLLRWVCGCAMLNRILQLPIVAPVTFADRVMTLASRSQQATIPGPEWHLNDKLVVRSLGYKTVALNEFILPAKSRQRCRAGQRHSDPQTVEWTTVAVWATLLGRAV
ncbi:hypothetical protein ACP0HM_28165 [Escherichia coli]